MYCRLNWLKSLRSLPALRCIVLAAILVTVSCPLLRLNSQVPLLEASPSAEATDTGPVVKEVQSAYLYLHLELAHYATGNDLRLLDSYVTTANFDDGDTAWTYDNALVMLAFLARGTAEDLPAARVLADSLVYAQTHDPEFSDGRVRDAYHAQTFVGADGKVNVAVSGSATGNMAWATLALVRAWERLGERAYLEAAQRLGQWIFDQAADPRGAGGYNGGVDEAGNRLFWKATEHNADVYAAFMNLYRATGDPAWRARAMDGKRFLVTLWDAAGGFFWTGTTEDGATINPYPRPEDGQSWTSLAMGEPGRYGRALAWAESELYCEACPACEAASGYRFSDAGSGCWPEGTAHMALAWQALDNQVRATRLLESLRRIRVPVPGLAGEAIPAACGADAVTGYGWNYPAGVPHIGATAWYLFAELGHNPFWGMSVDQPIPFEGLYDEKTVRQFLPVVRAGLAAPAR